MSLVGYFDGACEPRNPGGACGYGAALIRDGAVIWQTSGMFPEAPTNSNNVAEYSALLALLDYLIAEGVTEPVEVRGDSQLVINQMFGSWNINDGIYAAHARLAKQKLESLLNVTGRWVRRDENAFADNLSKQELHAAGIKFRMQRRA